MANLKLNNVSSNEEVKVNPVEVNEGEKEIEVPVKADSGRKLNISNAGSSNEAVKATGSSSFTVEEKEEGVKLFQNKTANKILIGVAIGFVVLVGGALIFLNLPVTIFG